MPNNCDEDNDVPLLSANTFQALQEFYQEQEERERQVLIPEDWQLSQFWYDEKTVESLVRIAVGSASAKIALISCPTLYTKLKEQTSAIVTLYEYDKRFAIYGEDFVAYDYKSPLNIPRDKSGYYDLVIADPPFLSEECLTKTAVTIKFLAKSKIVVCTGAIMEDLIARLLDLKRTPFKPQHQNNLANEFACFANFDITQY